jgi:hypothetical protein
VLRWLAVLDLADLRVSAAVVALLIPMARL